MDASPLKPPARNEPCHCGSGRKYKQCCLDKDETAARQARERARAEQAATAPTTDAGEGEPEADRHPSRPHGQHPHEKGGGRGSVNPRGFQKSTGTPRKVGGG